MDIKKMLVPTLILSVSIFGVTVASCDSSVNSTNNGAGSQISVSECVPVTSLNIRVQSIGINKGEKVKPTIEYFPKNATEKITLRTKTPELISIDAGGTITVLGVGTAVVYAESEKGLKSEECKIICSDIEDIVCPATFENYYRISTAFPYSLAQTGKITKFDLKFSTTTLVQRQAIIKYNISATKESVSNDLFSSSKLAIRMRILDPDGAIAYSGSVKSLNLSAGESTTIDGRITLSSSQRPGTYKVELQPAYFLGSSIGQ